MIVAEDSRDLPPQIDKCFDLTHCCVRVRQEPGSRVWEPNNGSSLGNDSRMTSISLIPQKDVESTFFTVYGITEIFGHTPQSDNEELLGFLVLLKNGYYLHIRLMWEASFPIK
jgi:nitrogen fixation protein